MPPQGRRRWRGTTRVAGPLTRAAGGAGVRSASELGWQRRSPVGALRASRTGAAQCPELAGRLPSVCTDSPSRRPACSTGTRRNRWPSLIEPRYGTLRFLRAGRHLVFFTGNWSSAQYRLWLAVKAAMLVNLALPAAPRQLPGVLVTADLQFWPGVLVGSCRHHFAVALSSWQAGLPL